MLSLQCVRRIVQARPLSKLPCTPSLQSSFRPLVSSQPSQSRTISLLSGTRPTLPSAPTSTLSLTTTLELPRASNPSTTLTLLQARGPKRDTYDPSHFVRKRRNGFLARLRTRNGRNLLKRRRLKRRSTLSH